MRSNLDLVNKCDSFPYTPAETNAWKLIFKSEHNSHTIGYMLESVVSELCKVPEDIRGALTKDESFKTIHAFQFPTVEERNVAVDATLRYWRERGTFKVLKGWRNETYPVYDSEGKGVVFVIERAASGLFVGILGFGVHLTVYARDPSASYGLKIWVARRASTKQTYPGMLDSSVAGGVATGDDVKKCLIRECAEEASLPASFVSEKAVLADVLTFVNISVAERGGEAGLFQPECLYVFEMEAEGGVMLKPNDGEVGEFLLCSVEEVTMFLRRGEFKYNCAVVMLAFFIRHEILSKENEENLVEIQGRIHRDLDIPGPHNYWK